MNRWIEIAAVVPADWQDVSVAIDAFVEFGCPGVQETSEPRKLVGNLPEGEAGAKSAADLATRLREIGALDVQTRIVQDQDWDALWRIHFKPRRVGKRFVIVPTWEDYPTQEGDLVVLLDPGRAFGTGDHPTTRLCLELLETTPVKGKTVADVGCGTGILAIGACLLGASKVIATDIDEVAVEVTRENAVLNKVEFEAFPADGFAGVPGEVDVLLSNIISATLIRLAMDAASHVKPGGCWIVSGIIRANWPDVQSAAEKAGFALEATAEEDDWVAARFRR